LDGFGDDWKYYPNIIAFLTEFSPLCKSQVLKFKFIVYRRTATGHSPAGGHPQTEYWCKFDPKKNRSRRTVRTA
jgi:hypothetical protein